MANKPFETSKEMYLPMAQAVHDKEFDYNRLAEKVGPEEAVVEALERRVSTLQDARYASKTEKEWMQNAMEQLLKDKEDLAHRLAHAQPPAAAPLQDGDMSPPPPPPAYPLSPPGSPPPPPPAYPLSPPGSPPPPPPAAAAGIAPAAAMAPPAEEVARAPVSAPPAAVVPAAVVATPLRLIVAAGSSIPGAAAAAPATSHCAAAAPAAARAAAPASAVGPAVATAASSAKPVGSAVPRGPPTRAASAGRDDLQPPAQDQPKTYAPGGSCSGAPGSRAGDDIRRQADTPSKTRRSGPAAASTPSRLQPLRSAKQKMAALR